MKNAKKKEVKNNYDIGTFDFETDPFEFGVVPKPFCVGMYLNRVYKEYWGDDCHKQLISWMRAIERPTILYAHNGGKFDFLFLMSEFNGAIKIVNGRILEVQIGKCILRDSYAIIPIPLAKYQKDFIDYKFMRKEMRDVHRDEILKYLKSDCVYLHELVDAFIDEFGDKLTIGGTAMSALKSFHGFKSGNAAYDARFRPYYYGGRCQCFESGVIDARIKIYDVNSMYPSVMRDFLHPISVKHSINNRINNKTNFVCWEGKNFNAVPVRTKFGLDFTTENGVFYTTVHEFNAGLETGTIEPKRIKHTVEFAECITFSDFVDYFYESRQIARKHNDLLRDIFYKLILNSAYGKFAQNPENYCESIILPWGEIPSDAEYVIEHRHNDYAIWSKPADSNSYYNVATAASITGASRAVLLRGLAMAERPLYCDTDSIICENFSGDVDKNKLGAWKLEDEGDLIAIAGKKLYAVMREDICVKKASKGSHLNPMAIFAIARGDTVEAKQDAPAFKFSGNHQFITRRIRATVNI